MLTPTTNAPNGKRADTIGSHVVEGHQKIITDSPLGAFALSSTSNK
jgi:hypothetical protein